MAFCPSAPHRANTRGTDPPPLPPPSRRTRGGRGRCSFAVSGAKTGQPPQRVSTTAPSLYPPGGAAAQRAPHVPPEAEGTGAAPLHSTPVLDATGASPTPEAPPLSRPPENPPINRRAAEIRRPMATASPLGPASPLPSALARGEGGETASPQHHSPPLPPRLYPHRRRRADVTAARTPLSNQWGEPTRRANERQRLSGGRSIGRAGGR